MACFGVASISRAESLALASSLLLVAWVGSQHAQQIMMAVSAAADLDNDRALDLVVNSSGLTDFNPDLREALASNGYTVVSIGADAPRDLLDSVEAADWTPDGSALIQR